MTILNHKINRKLRFFGSFGEHGTNILIGDDFWPFQIMDSTLNVSFWLFLSKIWSKTDFWKYCFYWYFAKNTEKKWRLGLISWTKMVRNHPPLVHLSPGYLSNNGKPSKIPGSPWKKPFFLAYCFHQYFAKKAKKIRFCIDYTDRNCQQPSPDSIFDTRVSQK